MLDVDLNELKNNILNLKKLINEYEEIELNLFNQLKESCMNWQDGNSLEFDNKMYLEKNEARLFLEHLKNEKEIFDFLYNKYSDIGKKIRCKLSNKSSIINSINNCYNQTVAILNEFNKIDRSFYYSELNAINSQKNKIIYIRDKLQEIKNSSLKLYNKIENIEIEVKDKIKKIDKVRINNFDFNIN